MPYKINLLGKEIRKQLGIMCLKDTLFTTGFMTLDPDALGTVSGSVSDEQEKRSVPIILILWKIGSSEISYQLTIPPSGAFLFERILPGKYLLGGFIDIDGNKIITLGQPHPFFPLEPFSLCPDTIYVRSRWETQGVELRFH